MKIGVEFTREVQASAEKLWDVLADVENWHTWQGIPAAKLSKHGAIKKGSTFTATLGGMKWDLVVTKAGRPHTIIWEGHRFGLKAIHVWEFKVGQDETSVITRETITGWLLFLIFPIARKRLAETDKKWLADLITRAQST